MDRYNWPQYPTVQQVIEFEQDLRDNKVRFNIGQYCEGQLWHISKVHGGDCDWATLDQWAEDHKEHVNNIVVSAQLFTWTANLTNTLVSAIFGWNQVFASNAPQVTQDVPEYEHPMPQQLAEQVAVEMHNTRVEQMQNETAMAIGTILQTIVQSLQNQEVNVNIPPINMPPREEKLKIKMPDEFKGEPALVGEWL